MCPESIPTVSIVSRCPANGMEWKSAAERKKCDFLGKIQNCTQAENFVYHCVLNKETTELVELCAPVWFMAGKYMGLMLLKLAKTTALASVVQTYYFCIVFRNPL